MAADTSLFSLDGRVVLITGAWGLGLAMAKGLAEAGATVSLMAATLT
jgi:NAD(P)-dependent dehydrogenase (short-subunit alcohol dehydrogenase family)